MKRLLSFFASVLAIMCSACTPDSGIACFWDNLDLTVTEDNFLESEDRFAGFAELALDAPFEDATAALGTLLDRLREEDEVAYYVYSEWIEAAFQNYFSPCRSPELFEFCAGRFAADGVLDELTMEHMQGLAELDSFNRTGAPCTLPQGVESHDRTLYLVLNLDCRGCREALIGLAGEHPDAAHVALCFGWNPLPDAEGWEYLKPEGMSKVFLTDAAPFWFLVAEDGTVEIPYSSVPQTDRFAEPQDQ